MVVQPKAPNTFFCRASDPEVAAEFVKLYNARDLQLGLNVHIGVEPYDLLTILIGRRSARGIFAETIGDALQLLEGGSWWVRPRLQMALSNGVYASIGQLLGDNRLNYLDMELQKALLLQHDQQATLHVNGDDCEIFVDESVITWRATPEDWSPGVYLCTNKNGVTYGSFMPIDDQDRLLK